MNPHGGLFISVPASPLSQRRERSAGKPPPFMMAFSQFQRCLRLSLRPFPSRAVRRSSQLQPVSPASHPKQLALRLRRFGEAPNHRHCPRNPHRAGASPSRREERNCPYPFETVPPMSALTLLQSKGVMSAPPSAPPPAIRQQSTSQPTHHAADSQSLLEACCRSPQRGQRYPGVRQPAPQSATHSGWSERSRPKSNFEVGFFLFYCS